MFDIKLQELSNAFYNLTLLGCAKRGSEGFVILESTFNCNLDTCLSEKWAALQ